VGLDPRSPLPSAATASNCIAIANLRRCVNLFRQQAFDGLLELAILSGVDERVNAGVEEHQHHGEVVEPSREVESVETEIIQKEANRVD